MSDRQSSSEPHKASPSFSDKSSDISHPEGEVSESPKDPKFIRGAGKRKRIMYGLLAVGLIVLTAMALLGFRLQQVVSDKFTGQLWQLPSVVYARELVLQPGAKVRYEEVLNELKQLKYQQVHAPSRSGEYKSSRLKLEFVRRPFTFKEGKEDERHVVVEFDYSSVKRISEWIERGGKKELKQLGIIRIEPKMLGMLESQTTEQRIYLPKDQMPTALIDALITTEDRDFYQHDGVSIVAIGRAFVANIKAGRTVQGGSTLTQQLAKNLFLSSERSLWRKIKEAYMALIIDHNYDKDQILDAYLNQVYLAQSGKQAIHGFAMGARFYFGRPLSELRVDQQALLVGLVKGPSYYNPWRYPERATARRNLVLRMMHDSQMIDSASYERAIQRPLDVQEKGQLSRRQPAYFDQLRRELTEEVGDKFESGKGLRLFTTLDPLSQEKAEEAVRATMPKLAKKAGANIENAIVIADRNTGEVRAMVGGSKPGYAGFNRAIDAKRQIGSVVKPAIYLAALSQPERFSLATSLEDKPLKLTGERGEIWSPRNYDRQYRGAVPLYLALAKSYNIPTVNLGMAVGLDGVIDTMAKLGVDRKEIPPLPSMLLGAFTLTPFEVTQMYQTIASGGRKAQLKALSAVVTNEGEVLFQQLPVASQVVPEQAAWLTMYGLQKAVTEGTARYLNGQLPSSRLAGKTGTSDKGRDSWYVGIDGREVVTVWMGKDDNSNSNLTGSSGALRLYTDYILRRDPEPLVQQQPSGISTFDYQRNQNGTYSQRCLGQDHFPAWDPNGTLKVTCVKKVQRFFQNLFDW
ncbi:penicillin-binding protein 1B [Photobacterium kagoshimensis]|uniref:penicillin-binding protein 1B n=1 Tax=Photobacterium kagoshimensis TaxID=2910242 RepID=UPI003D0E47FB